MPVSKTKQPTSKQCRTATGRKTCKKTASSKRESTKKAAFKNKYSFEDYQTIHDALQVAFESVQAPIMDLIAAQTQDPYKILVGTILSARTLDQTTAGALERLFPIAPDLEALDKCSLEAIEKAIYPVGFYHDKARHLKTLPQAVMQLFGGKIPETVEELIQLPGVGRKTANLVVALAFKKPAICVDTHVHRINNRLAIVKTKTPLETEMALRQCLPECFWIAWNAIFVSFGQTRCRPIGPRCEGCPIARFCQEPLKR